MKLLASMLASQLFAESSIIVTLKLLCAQVVTFVRCIPLHFGAHLNTILQQ